MTDLQDLRQIENLIERLLEARHQMIPVVRRAPCPSAAIRRRPGPVISALQGQGIVCARTGPAREADFGLRQRQRQPDGALVELARFEVDEMTWLLT